MQKPGRVVGSWPFPKGVLACALPPKWHSLLIHRFFMSSLHIYEGMKVATLVATLPFWSVLRITNVTFKIAF